MKQKQFKNTQQSHKMCQNDTTVCSVVGIRLKIIDKRPFTQSNL